MGALSSIWAYGNVARSRQPVWSPCLSDPEVFDCNQCEIGWNPCKLRTDDSLRHWRAAWYNHRAGMLSIEEERDNAIESEIVEFLGTHGISVNSDLLFEYLPQTSLKNITNAELGELLRKSSLLVESSPRMYKLRTGLDWEDKEKFKSLPISSGTQLACLIDHFPALDLSAQTQMFKEYSGLKLLVSASTWEKARTDVHSIIDNTLEDVMARHGWDIRSIHRYALGPDPVPHAGDDTEDELSEMNTFFSAIIAEEMLGRMTFEAVSQRFHDIRDDLILSNIRLVISIARTRAQGDDLDLMDTFQSGVMGLMTAIDRFDAFRGLRFSTFATHWIRQTIGRSQANEGRSVRLPVHVHEELRSFHQQLVTIINEFEREPSAVQVTRMMHMDLDKMEYFIELGKPIVSLDLMLEVYRDSAEQLLWEDVIDSEESNVMDYSFLKSTVANALSTLSAREREVIGLRFGIGGYGPYTLERIGQVFGVTRERIRQIEAKALRKLRHPSRARPLRKFLTDPMGN